MSEEQKNSELEIEEIRRRVEYLASTDTISLTEKIAIAKKALEIIEEDKVKRAVK